MTSIRAIFLKLNIQPNSKDKNQHSNFPNFFLSHAPLSETLFKYIQMKNWIDLKNFEGLYQISNLGEVRSIRNSKNNILKYGVSGKGYFQVNLCRGGYCKNHLLHRLLAIHFIPNPQNKPTVNHNNGIKTDNRIENLEWATFKEQMQHAFRTGLKKPVMGMIPKSRKLTQEKVNEIRSATNITQTNLSKKYGISVGQIQRILKNQNWK